MWGGNQECFLYTTMCRTVSRSEEFALIPCNFKNSFCTTKETISKVKRQPSGRKKIIANEATDRELISKIYKQLLELNSRKK